MVDDVDAALPHHVPAADSAAGPVPEVPGYELGALLARGGTSEVWAGVSHDGGRRVAVKVVHADLEGVEAAAREAALSARAAGAHLVPVEACVPLVDGRVAVVMPHLLGGALDALVRARGHLSPGEVVTVLAPVASALGGLHDLGVVHGDVSPGNVLLDLDGRPLLGDLGLGHVVGEISPGVWGTEGYVAPEVLFGADPTPASDVYALGALGWLCVSGTLPGPPGLRPELAEVCLAGEGSEPLVSALAAAVAAEPADRPGAHELAWLLFAATEPEPLRLVHGDDEVSAVTYRLRAAAGRAPVPAARTRWRTASVPWRRAPSQPSPARGPIAPRRWSAPRVAAPSGAGWRSSRPGPRHARQQAGLEPGRRRRSAVGRLVAVGAVVVPVLVALLVLGVALLGREGAARAGSTTGGSVPSSESLSSSASSPARPGAERGAGSTDPRTDRAAARTRPAALLDALSAARAAAWREATPALLHAAVAPGSPAAARDAAAVAELARAGVRYTGLDYRVADVETLSATPARAVLRARIDSGPYDVTGSLGSTPRPAVVGRPVLVDLVFTEVGWRVSDVRPAT